MPAQPERPRKPAKRPRKAVELHEGPEAAKRFMAGLKSVIVAGPRPKGSS